MTLPQLPTPLPPYSSAVAVEHLAPAGTQRHADAVVEARHRREVGDDQDRLASGPWRTNASTLFSASLASIHSNRPGRVEGVQRRLGPIQRVEVVHPRAQTGVVGLGQADASRALSL
jgi:hypothetical protein